MSIYNTMNVLDSHRYDIASAIESKGINMAGVTFPDYANKINEIKISTISESTSSVINITNGSYITLFDDVEEGYISCSAWREGVSGINVKADVLTGNATLTEIKYVDYNTTIYGSTRLYKITASKNTQIIFKIVNGSGTEQYAVGTVTVMGVHASLGEPEWVYKTGGFINMTSNNAPSPFTAYLDGAYGDYSVENENWWLAFNGDPNSNVIRLKTWKPEGSTQNAYVGVQCSFGKLIRAVSLKIDLEMCSNGNLEEGNGGGIVLVKNGVNISEIINPSSVIDFSDQPNGYLEIDAIKFFCRNTTQRGDFEYIYVKNIQVTKWYELKVLSLYTGTHATATLELPMNGTETKTVTSSSFSAVKPRKLHLNWTLNPRGDVGTVEHSIQVQGYTTSGKWITLWSASKNLDPDSTWYMNSAVNVSSTEAVTKLRTVTAGRYWAHTQTIKITEWYA